MIQSAQQTKPMGGQADGNLIGEPHSGMLNISVDQETFVYIKSGLLDFHHVCKSPYWTSRLEGRNYQLIRISNNFKQKNHYIICEYQGYFVAQSQHAVKINKHTYKRLVNPGDYVIKIGSILTEGIKK